MAGSQTDITNRDAHDSFTGLPKRNRFLDPVQFAMDRYQVNSQKHLLSILHINLNLFKVIYDINGHLFGARVLVTFVTVLSACLAT